MTETARKPGWAYVTDGQSQEGGLHKPAIEIAGIATECSEKAACRGARELSEQSL